MHQNYNMLEIPICEISDILEIGNSNMLAILIHWIFQNVDNSDMLEIPKF